MVRRYNSQPGSAYHLSSLRYAEGSSAHQARHLPVGPLNELGRNEGGASAAPARRDRFSEAEDSYRAGHSSSSSLLIRSSLLSTTESLHPYLSHGVAGEIDQDASEGFHRTKARSLLAQSVNDVHDNTKTSQDDTLIGLLNTADVGSSVYYLPGRKAKRPLSLDKYEENRRKRRAVKDRARKRAVREREADGRNARAGGHNEREEILQEGTIGSDLEDDGSNGHKRLTETEQKEMESQIEDDIESTHRLMPSGTLLETVHYVASHYYDARDMLFARQGAAESALADGQESRTNLWRVFESNALVALGVYMEEVIKFEVAAQGTRSEDDQLQTGNAGIVQQLTQVQDELRRRRRRTRASARQRTKGKGRKEVQRGTDIGWALPRSHAGPSRQQAEVVLSPRAAAESERSDSDGAGSEASSNQDSVAKQ